MSGLHQLSFTKPFCSPSVVAAGTVGATGAVAAVTVATIAFVALVVVSRLLLMRLLVLLLISWLVLLVLALVVIASIVRSIVAATASAIIAPVGVEGLIVAVMRAVPQDALRVVRVCATTLTLEVLEADPVVETTNTFNIQVCIRVNIIHSRRRG